MIYQASVYVRLKKGYSDPEGETTANALRGLGYDVTEVRSSKSYEVTLEASSKRRRSVSSMRCAEGSSRTLLKTIIDLS